MTDWLLVDLLARVARNAPHAVRLAAQLFGVAPCERCDFVKAHCRCQPSPDDILHDEGK